MLNSPYNELSVTKMYYIHFRRIIFYYLSKSNLQFKHYRLLNKKLYFKIPAGMFCCQYIALFSYRNMSIYFRDINRTMTEHFLNISDINIRFKKTGGKCVPEHMRSDVQFYGGQRTVFVNHSTHRLIG